MLKILKGQDDLTKGIVVCEESGNASSLPLLLHYLSLATTEQNSKVALVTSKLTEANYKLICSKAGVRWNPSQIVFRELIPSLESFDVQGKSLMEDIQKTIQESQVSAVLFDDLSPLEHLGASSLEITLFLHDLYSSLLTAFPEKATVFASFSCSPSLSELLRPRCHVFAQFIPVGHGFGKDASSKAIFSITSVGGLVSKKGLLLSGERAITGTWVLAD